MTEVLLLRLDAPLMSFGTTAVDQFGVVQGFPALSMLTGLLANALGFERKHPDKLQRLQERIRYAVRCDRTGQIIRDFHTVDLGQEHLDADRVGWTTWGQRDLRKGGEDAKRGTHIRFRDYQSDSVFTVAITLDPADESPTLDEVADAIEAPARPLFIGRKCCLPSGPILAGRGSYPNPLAALAAWPRLPPPRGPKSGPLSAWWTEGEAVIEGQEHSRLVPVTDERDWTNQIHVGRRLVRHGRVDPPEASHG